MQIEGRYKTNIRRIAKEFYGNSGPELEYINLSIEKKVYIHIYILLSKFIFEISMFVAIVASHSTTLYPRIVCEINREKRSARKRDMYTIRKQVLRRLLIVFLHLRI